MNRRNYAKACADSASTSATMRKLVPGSCYLISTAFWIKEESAFAHSHSGFVLSRRR